MSELIAKFEDDNITFELDGEVRLVDFIQVSRWVSEVAIRYVLSQPESTAEEVADVILNISSVLGDLFRNVMNDEDATEQQKQMLQQGIDLIWNKIRESSNEQKE